MPTMAKLISAILLGILGYVAADRIAAHMPEEVRKGMLMPVSVIAGIVVGWRFMGRRAVGNMSSAIGIGLSAVVIQVLVAVFAFAFSDMIRRSLRKAYGGNPVEALEDMFQIAIEHMQYLLPGDVLVVLLGGGALCGIIATIVARRWS